MELAEKTVFSKPRPNNILAAWFVWHFFEMPAFLLSVYRNYLLFALDYFSVPLLVVTFFSPWRHYRWKYPKSFDVGQYLGNFVFNTFSRIMGAACRVILIMAGVLAVIITGVVGALFIIMWLAAPLVIAAIIVLVIYV